MNESRVLQASMPMMTGLSETHLGIGKYDKAFTELALMAFLSSHILFIYIYIIFIYIYHFYLYIFIYNIYIIIINPMQWPSHVITFKPTNQNLNVQLLFLWSGKLTVEICFLYKTQYIRQVATGVASYQQENKKQGLLSTER